MGAATGGLDDVSRLDVRAAVQIGNGARHAQDPVVRSR
jgi:hypothetical protein